MAFIMLKIYYFSIKKIFDSLATMAQNFFLLKNGRKRYKCNRASPTHNNKYNNINNRWDLIQKALKFAEIESGQWQIFDCQFWKCEKKKFKFAKNLHPTQFFYFCPTKCMFIRGLKCTQYNFPVAHFLIMFFFYLNNNGSPSISSRFYRVKNFWISSPSMTRVFKNTYLMNAKGITVFNERENFLIARSIKGNCKNTPRVGVFERSL